MGFASAPSVIAECNCQAYKPTDCVQFAMSSHDAFGIRSGQWRSERGVWGVQTPPPIVKKCVFFTAWYLNKNNG